MESEKLGELVSLAVVVIDTMVPTVFVWPKKEVTMYPNTVDMDSP